MDDESNNSETETALSYDDVVAKFEASYEDDMPETSEDSEQVDADNVEEIDVSEDTDTPDDVEQTFEIDGNQVSLTELRNGYLRQADYTRKTTEISEQRKVYEAAQFDKHQVRQEALQGIETLKMHLAAEFSQLEVPDWEYLVENEPAEYQRQQFLWGKREAAVQQMYQAEMALRQKAEAYENERDQHVIHESKNQFLAKYPEMRDAGVNQQVLGEITGIMVDNGFSKEEISSVSDYRVVGLLYELSKLMKAQKTIPQVVAKMEQKKPISQKNSSVKPSDAYTASKNKFNKSRSMDDLAALIEQSL